MKDMKKKTIGVVIIVLALACAAYLLFFPVHGGKNVPYTDFHTELESGNVQRVTLRSDGISYTLRDGSTFKTDNPDSEGFKEQLLLKGIAVSDEREDGFTKAMDMLFNVFFIGLLFFILYKAIGFSKKTFKVVRHSGVRFSDIAGMAELKKEMLQAVDVLSHREEYAKRGVRPNKGIILEGPPGNGKTLFAKALAEEANVRFIAAKGADFQSALMSVGAMKIRMLFHKARKHKPCIIFIDEFDSIGERRNFSGTGIDKENNRIITTMLNEMDGFTALDGVLVIAATNTYASLDPALVRPGRFDLKYTIGNPDDETRKELIGMYGKGKKYASDLSSEVLSRAFNGLSCAAIETILNEASALVSLEKREEITRDDIVRAARKTGSNTGGR
jgi:cell division protease FtsH